MKVNSISGNRSILDLAKQLRVEREREQKNSKQIQEIRLEVRPAPVNTYITSVHSYVLSPHSSSYSLYCTLNSTINSHAILCC